MKSALLMTLGEERKKNRSRLEWEGKTAIIPDIITDLKFSRSESDRNTSILKVFP